MNAIDAAAVVDYAQSLWPEWLPDDTLIRVWANQFQRYDEHIIRQAITEFKTEHKAGSFKAPKIYNILKIAKPRQNLKRKEQQVRLPEVPGFSLRRTHLDGRVSEKQFWIRSPGGKGFCNKETMPTWDVVQRIAESLVERFKSGSLRSLYPAKLWEIIRGPSFAEELPF